MAKIKLYENFKDSDVNCIRIVVYFISKRYCLYENNLDNKTLHGGILLFIPRQHEMNGSEHEALLGGVAPVCLFMESLLHITLVLEYPKKTKVTSLFMSMHTIKCLNIPRISTFQPHGHCI